MNKKETLNTKWPLRSISESFASAKIKVKRPNAIMVSEEIEFRQEDKRQGKRRRKQKKKIGEILSVWWDERLWSKAIVLWRSGYLSELFTNYRQCDSFSHESPLPSLSNLTKHSLFHHSLFLSHSLSPSLSLSHTLIILFFLLSLSYSLLLSLSYSLPYSLPYSYYSLSSRFRTSMTETLKWQQA